MIGLPTVLRTLPGYDLSIGGSGMNSQRYSPEFKDEAVRQIVDRGYSVTEVSERLGVSAHSLYKWVKAVKPDKTEEQAAALIFVTAVRPLRIN
ncbi:MAG: transposase-like protein [Lysobacterales bacterium]|jgi:transposase-like protein